MAPDFRPTEMALTPTRDPLDNQGHWLVRQPLNTGKGYYPYTYSVGRDGKRNIWPGERGWAPAVSV